MTETDTPRDAMVIERTFDAPCDGHSRRRGRARVRVSTSSACPTLPGSFSSVSLGTTSGRAAQTPPHTSLGSPPDCPHRGHLGGRRAVRPPSEGA